MRIFSVGYYCDFLKRFVDKNCSSTDIVELASILRDNFHTFNIQYLRLDGIELTWSATHHIYSSTPIKTEFYTLIYMPISDRIVDVRICGALKRKTFKGATDVLSFESIFRNKILRSIRKDILPQL